MLGGEATELSPLLGGGLAAWFPGSSSQLALMGRWPPAGVEVEALGPLSVGRGEGGW